MSFNLERKVRRNQMKVMIKEFVKENKLSQKAFIERLFQGKNIRKPSLSLKFARMINLATAAYDKEKGK